MRPPVTVGELIRINEEDYCYGLGALTLHVTEVPARLQEPDWVDLRGIEIAWNGERRRERHVRIRVSALRNPRSRKLT